jgi:CBS domain-containing protein
VKKAGSTEHSQGRGERQCFQTICLQRIKLSPKHLVTFLKCSVINKTKIGNKEIAMLKAKNIMVKEVITVKRDTPIFEAVELLWKNNITGVPVVEDDMTLVGVLTEKDVLRLFYTHEDHKNETVNSFMSQPAVHVDENEPLSEACACLMNYFLRRVPVASKGKVVGIISRPDLIKYILRQRQGHIASAGATSK